MTTILHTIVRDSPELAKLTREKYLHDLDAWIAFAGTNPAGWTRYRAQEFYTHLLEGGMRPQSANRLMTSLRYAASWWAKKENRPELDFSVVQRAAPRRKQVRRALEHDEALQLLGTCATTSPIDLRDRAMMVVLLETGMRRMSLTAIEIDKIKTSREGYAVALVPLKGSGDELYPVPLSDTALAAIEPWRAWLRSQKVTKGPLFRGLTRRIATNGKHRGHNRYHASAKGLSNVAIYKIIKHRADQAKLSGVHPHTFRHTFITWRMQAGLAPHEVASITGHKIAGMRGMGGLGNYVDAARIGGDVRNRGTPTWLTNFTGSDE